jgi:hypothetical protein
MSAPGGSGARRGVTGRFAMLAICSWIALALLPRAIPALAAHPAIWLYYLTLPLLLLVLVALALWGAIGWAAARDDASRRARAHARLRLAGSGLAAFAAVLLLLRLWPAGLPGGSDLRPFDRTAWQAPDAIEFVKGDVTPRQKMLQDVVEGVLPGRDRAAIEAELGAGDSADYFATRGHDLLYRLGPQRDTPFSLDSEWLLIWLDAEGRFERYAIGHD